VATNNPNRQIRRSGNTRAVQETGNGVDFQELESLRRLKAIDITIQSVEALDKLSRSNRLAGSTRNLLIREHVLA
jgi:hypothetical protein